MFERLTPRVAAISNTICRTISERYLKEEPKKELDHVLLNGVPLCAQQPSGGTALATP